MTSQAYEMIPETALGWANSGVGAALATVVTTWGSAPRPAGSQLAVSGTGQMAGSVSGGCVEGAVVHAALAALADGTPRLLTFGIADDDAFAVGLACGGTIRVLVEPVGHGPRSLSPDLLQALVDARAFHQPVALLTNLETFQRRLVSGPGDPLAPQITARHQSDRSGPEEDGWFIGIHNPPLRMLIVGAVHIAQPLVMMARACGYAPTIIDPRASFGSVARFPGETICDDWPDQAIVQLRPDPRTAIITLTHDPKLDDPALTEALKTDAFYIGSLGSTRTHSKRLERLRAAGVGDDMLARLHAPVGLRIGARSPAEIAVSIMAQLTQVLRQP